SLANSRWRILRFPLSESTLIFRIFSLRPPDTL
ncbi:gamma carbonic anhydrase family protein, partial [Serratia marcescens]